MRVSPLERPQRMPPGVPLRSPRASPLGNALFARRRNALNARCFRCLPPPTHVTASAFFRWLRRAAIEPELQGRALL
jgi:hypothetical protein